MKRQLALLAILVLILATSLTANAAGHTKGRAVEPLTTEFKPGDYVWHPEISPAGPVVIIVSLPEQKMYVYRNGVRIGRSTISTGMFCATFLTRLATRSRSAAARPASGSSSSKT